MDEKSYKSMKTRIFPQELSNPSGGNYQKPERLVEFPGNLQVIHSMITGRRTIPFVFTFDGQSEYTTILVSGKCKSPWCTSSLNQVRYGFIVFCK
jgi:hypothetical protein